MTHSPRSRQEERARDIVNIWDGTLYPPSADELKKAITSALAQEREVALGNAYACFFDMTPNGVIHVPADVALTRVKKLFNEARDANIKEKKE